MSSDDGGDFAADRHADLENPAVVTCPRCAKFALREVRAGTPVSMMAAEVTGEWDALASDEEGGDGGGQR